MIELMTALSAWKTPDFETQLKAEIEKMTGKQLPLQKGLSYSSYALDDDIKSTILNISEDSQSIQVKAGLFYKGIIAGCSCSDDPSPVDEQLEYCEVILVIDKLTARTDITLIDN